jgi:hypothetical protein
MMRQTRRTSAVSPGEAFPPDRIALEAGPILPANMASDPHAKTPP